MICAGLLTYALGTAKDAFDLILSVGAGTGLIYILRWFWWRVSAWSEIAAMASSFIVALGFFIAHKNGVEIASHVTLLATVGITTVVWVGATFLAPGTDRATLMRFYELVRPSGAGWSEIRAASGKLPAPDSLAQGMLGWLCGCCFVYSGLFGTGSFLYGRYPQFGAWLVVFVISGLGVWQVLRGFWPAAE